MTESIVAFPRAGPHWDVLPRLLQGTGRFLPWRAIPKRSGFRKVPLGRKNGTWQVVNSSDSAHHLTLEEALNVVRAGHATGVGVHLDATFPLVAIDLDRCMTAEGQPDELAPAVLAAFPGTYAELSPSGLGLHLLVPGVCPPGWRRRAGIEVLDAGFVTVTGQGIRLEDDPSDRSAQLAAWHASWTPTRTFRAAHFTRPLRPASGWSNRTAALFAELEAGGHAHYPSASEADLAYLLLLLRREPWLSDSALLAHVHASGRMRPKWTQTAYLTATLTAARRIRARSAS